MNADRARHGSQRAKVIPLPQGLSVDAPAVAPLGRRLIWQGADAIALPGVKRRTLIATLAGVLALCGLALTAAIWRNPEVHVSLVILAGVFCAELLAVPWLCRQDRHIDLAGALVVGGLAGFVALLAFLAGGLDQPLITLIVAIPVIATALLSPRAGVSATLTLCLAVGLMLFLQLRGMAPQLLQLSQDEATLLRGMVLMLGTIGSATAIWAYESRMRGVLERWRARNQPDAVSGQMTPWQFDQGLRAQLGRVPPPAARATLFLVDVDRFTEFQRQHGQADADELLRRVGASVRASALGSQTLVARLDADCFGLFCWCSSRSGVRTIYDRIQLLVSATTGDLHWTGGSGVTVSIGIAELAPQDCARPGADQRLHAGAAAALQAARAMGGNKVRLQADAA